jgi:LytS/YehU family sensor histidine kinase
MQQQMALSKKQMEPHFMLNMINNIGYMFSKDNKQDAMFYLGKFGSLMRQGLINSQASQITLEEELEFVEDYLILQKKLMDDELEYSIQIEEIVEEELIQIPHSIVYTFVENAIKHGLKPKEKDRLLEIKVEQGNEQVRISIKDNGIGRQKSKEYGTTDTGKGMEIIKNIIMGYNQLHDGKISYDVENVLDENNKTIGTRVVIWV